jgi:hypothetical protein
MPPPFWATAGQQQWLNEWMPKFLIAQKQTKLADFWPVLYAAWFQEFPERPLDPEHTPAPQENEEHGKALAKRQKVFFYLGLVILDP